MIRFSAEDSNGAIELLCKNRSHHLVGEGHRRKGQPSGRPVIDFLRKAVGAAHDEYQVPATVHPLLQVLGEFHGAELFSVFIEQHDLVRGLHGGVDHLSFPLLDLVLGQGGCVFEFGNFDQRKRHIMLQP